MTTQIVVSGKSKFYTYSGKNSNDCPAISDIYKFLGPPTLTTQQWPSVYFGSARRHTATRGVMREEQCPGCRITGGHGKVPVMSHVLSSIQCIYSQKTLSSNVGVPNLSLAPAQS